MSLFNIHTIAGGAIAPPGNPTTADDARGAITEAHAFQTLSVAGLSPGASAGAQQVAAQVIDSSGSSWPGLLLVVAGVAIVGVATYFIWKAAS